MITSPRRPSLRLFFAGLAFILSFFIIQNTPSPKRAVNKVLEAYVQSNIQESVQKVDQAFPVHIKIPSIGVDAVITNVGVTSNGEMDVPSNILDVGWLDNGPIPGEKGSAVLAGHFNGTNGEEGVFANLGKLKERDIIYIGDNKGNYKTFLFRKSQEYSPGYADDVFNQNDKSYLNLVTCDGVWDPSKKTFSKRLVVFAGLVL